MSVHSTPLSNVAHHGNMICSATFSNARGMDIDEAGDRLKYAREQAGFESAEKFAKALGVNPTTYRAYENNQNGFAKSAPRFARKLGVPTDWLLGGGPTPEIANLVSAGAAGTPDILTDNFNIELVRQVDISYAMGSGAVLDDYPETGLIPFDKNFLRVLTRSPVESLFVARGDGDSMIPTLINDDLVLIDSAQQRLSLQDRLWALALDGAGMIKRLRTTPGGRLSILSDNSSVPTQEVLAKDVYIVGRVVWVGRRL